MYLRIWLVYDLNTGKRKGRFVEVTEVWDGLPIESELPTQLLLPRVLPQEWLPAGLRTGRSGPVARWTDASMILDTPEGES